MRRTCVERVTGIGCLIVCMGSVLMGSSGCSDARDADAPANTAATPESTSTAEAPKTTFGQAAHSAEKLHGAAEERNGELAEQAATLDDDGDDRKDGDGDME